MLAEQYGIEINNELVICPGDLNSHEDNRFKAEENFGYILTSQEQVAGSLGFRLNPVRYPA